MRTGEELENSREENTAQNRFISIHSNETCTQGKGKKKKNALAPVTVYIFLANYNILWCSLADIEIVYL